MQPENKELRVLIYDIETAPILGWVWKMYDANVLGVEQHSHMLCFAYKWLGEKKTHIVALPDFELYDTEPTNDYGLCQELHALFDEADVVMGHNSVGFDDKVVRGRLIQQGFSPPSPFRTIDTLKIARSQFKLTNNKLDTIGDLLGVGRKTAHAGMSLWFGCMAGCEKSWKKMKEYNIQDVDLLEAVYMKLRPWAFGHVDLRADMSVSACHKCGSTDLMKRGFSRTTRVTRQRYQCKGCGSWLQSRTAEKLKPAKIVGAS